MAKIDWASLLEDENAEDLWNGLYQLVSRHPAVRPLHYSSDGAAVSSRLEINADLTQELFLQLLQKQRFEHYLATGYDSSEIENELVYIELPNLVGARLRSRYPESFRMARRVSSLLKNSSRFCKITRKESRRERPLVAAAAAGQFPSDPVGEIEDDEESNSGADGRNGSGSSKHQRMVNQVFGLREWPSSKKMGDPGRFEDFTNEVPMRKRDTRIVGRSGSSQLIISNHDLEHLIVEILRAIDSPADVRTIRHLALSKIPMQDYRVSSLDAAFTPDDNGRKPIPRDASDPRETPESELLIAEHGRAVRGIATNFLSSLRSKVNNNQRRYDRLVQTMWHVYFDPLAPSQIEIAAMLGVSDSLVSDNRRMIDYELKKLGLSRDEGFVFSECLRQLVAAVVAD
jgi:hypothetical protein